MYSDSSGIFTLIISRKDLKQVAVYLVDYVGVIKSFESQSEIYAWQSFI